MEYEYIIPTALNAYKASKNKVCINIRKELSSNSDFDSVLEMRFFREQILNCAVDGKFKFCSATIPYSSKKLELLDFKVEILKIDKNLLYFLDRKFDETYIKLCSLLHYIERQAGLIEVLYGDSKIESSSGLIAFYNKFYERFFKGFDTFLYVKHTDSPRVLAPSATQSLINELHSYRNQPKIDLYKIYDDIHESCQLFNEYINLKNDISELKNDYADIPPNLDSCYRVSWNHSRSKTINLNEFSAAKFEWVSKYFHLILRGVVDRIKQAINNGEFSVTYIIGYGDDGFSGMSFYIDDLDDVVFPNSSELEFAEGLESLLNEVFVKYGYRLKFSRFRGGVEILKYETHEIHDVIQPISGDELRICFYWDCPIVFD